MQDNPLNSNILLLVRIFPQIIQLGIEGLITGIILCTPRLIYVFFIRKT